MEIEHWFGALRRRGTLFLSVVGCSLLVGLVLAMIQDPVYKAKAEVVLAPSAGATLLGTTESTPDLAAELKSARGEQVATAAKDELDLGEEVSVTVTADDASMTLSFEGTGGSAQEAADVANAFATGYVEVRQQRADAEYEAALERLRARISDIDEELADLGETSATNQDSRTTLIAQRSAYRSAVDRLEVAAIVGGTSGARVLTVAEPPAQRSSPVLSNYLAFALVAGLFLGAGAVGLAEFLDRSVPDAETARAAAGGAPVLARFRRRRVPLTRRMRLSRAFTQPSPAAVDAGALSSVAAGEQSTGVVLLDEPNSVESEAQRSLRTTVQSMVDAARPFLQVTSVADDDGGAEIAANLAAAIALTGQPTVLVCFAEMKGIRFDVDSLAVNDPLDAFLTGSALTTECLATVSGVDHLTVIVGSDGRAPDDNARRSIADGLKQLHSLARTVIVYSPPVLTSAVALEVADLVDGTIVVVRERSTETADLEEVSRALSLMEAPLLGVVLT